MRVNINSEQAETILNALENDHLCDICDGKTECQVKKLIKKFRRITSGEATLQGVRGGVGSKLSRREEKQKILDELAFTKGRLEGALNPI